MQEEIEGQSSTCSLRYMLLFTPMYEAFVSIQQSNSNSCTRTRYPEPNNLRQSLLLSDMHFRDGSYCILMRDHTGSIFVIRKSVLLATYRFVKIATACSPASLVVRADAYVYIWLDWHLSHSCKHYSRWLAGHWRSGGCGITVASYCVYLCARDVSGSAYNLAHQATSHVQLFAGWDLSTCCHDACQRSARDCCVSRRQYMSIGGTNIILCTVCRCFTPKQTSVRSDFGGKVKSHIVW